MVTGLAQGRKPQLCLAGRWLSVFCGPGWGAECVGSPVPAPAGSAWLLPLRALGPAAGRALLEQQGRAFVLVGTREAPEGLVSSAGRGGVLGQSPACLRFPGQDQYFGDSWTRVATPQLANPIGERFPREKRKSSDRD